MSRSEKNFCRDSRQASDKVNVKAKIIAKSVTQNGASMLKKQVMIHSKDGKGKQIRYLVWLIDM